ncbi:hypothetical protein [Mycobacterium asiaticum]|uniref:hypothetical protein n=1 Tax=Mycobacterium asiaticum TaxID=1790 RepID=UPI000A967F76|nr:hypothetical protein [Mycobacterium asiaticum]
MSEISDTPTTRTSTAVAPQPVHTTPKVFRAAAWVAIVAGIVFIVSVIFFTGFRLGLAAGHGGHHGHHHKHHPAMFHRSGFPKRRRRPAAGGPRHGTGRTRPGALVGDALHNPGPDPRSLTPSTSSPVLVEHRATSIHGIFVA